MTRVLVIGGGFSGALTAFQLRARGIDAIVVEEGPLGRGLAYREDAADLLLNTPAGAMSALPDRPGDFVAWLGTGETFAARSAYGAYVAGKLGGITQVPSRAIDVFFDGGRYRVRCRDGRELDAEQVVLALGNAPPRPVVEGEISPREAPLSGPIALIGTGLTALDAVATLRARGFTGELYGISRRGRVPHLHPGVPVTTRVALPSDTSLTSLLAWWRTSADASAKLEALRPRTPAIWRGWSEAERAGFVRHVRPHWEAIRHRAPPPIHALLASLTLVRGAIRSASSTASGTRLVVGDRTLDVAAVINCTGPERDLARSADPLVQQLLARGLVRPDALGLGAAWLADGLHAIGPWRIAERYESTAVAELRVQAVEIAEAIRTSRRADPTPA